MKRNLIGLAAAFALICSASAAQAQIFSIAADIPVNYQFDSGGSADDVSGFKFAVNFPFFVGFGFEDYTASIGTADVDFQIFDVFLDLPTPFINIGLGLGFGKASVSAPAAFGTFDDASIFQFFTTLGIPFATVWDVHIGYHVLSGTADSTSGAGGVEVDGKMLSLGIRLGF